MSARGARSRKVQQKEIHKQEKKETVRGKRPQVDDEETDDGSINWHKPVSRRHAKSAITKPTNASSNISRRTSHSDGSNDNSSRSRSRMNTGYSNDLALQAPLPPRSSGSGSISISIPESFERERGKERIKFDAHGRGTKAPRGRGGGVPTKKTVAISPTPQIFLNDFAASHSASNQRTWSGFKIWEGSRDEMRSYGGFDFDRDLQSGSVLIFFKEEQFDEDHPMPSLRADLEVLEFSGSTWLSSALHYGKIEDSDIDEWSLPRTPDSLKPLQYFPTQSSQLGTRKLSIPSASGGKLPSHLDQSRGYTSINPRAPSRAKQISDLAIPDRIHTPPPNKRRPSIRHPTHEIWFTAPNTVKTPQGQRLHHVAIRNFLALLHGKPIVGADFYEMLDTLQREIQIMYDIDGHSQSTYTSRDRSVRMITECIEKHHLDDVRDNVRQALGLLAWSEQEDVKWRQGYLESFVHLAGALTPQVEELEEFKRLSVITRRNLALTSKTLQLRVMEAEEKLAAFDFGDLWENTSKVANNPVHQSYQSFRQFLIVHYTRRYGSWAPETNDPWLNREIVLSLQEDFGSLYDYLVNRDVIWNPREERASRKWEMAHRQNEDFQADLLELGITDMLITFDAKYGYSHIPHPYPLLPRAVPKSSKEKEKKGFFDRMMKNKNKDATKDAKEHLQLSIFFSDATNIEKLDVNFNGSTLIDKFEKFELTTDLKHVTPREARLGRWVLLYGVLQVLSTLSVDVQGIQYKDNVSYFLCTDLKRCPEWVTVRQTARLEANQQRSWCWQRAWDPTPQHTGPIELDASSMASRNSLSRQSSREQLTQRNRSYSNFSARGNPTPPPAHPLPAPPPQHDSNVLLANDIRRIGEKLDEISLKQSASQIFRQELERKRDNEKAMQKDFQDRQAIPSQPSAMNTSRSLRSRENSLTPLSEHKPKTHENSLSLFPDSTMRSRQNSVAHSSHRRTRSIEEALPPLTAEHRTSPKTNDSGTRNKQQQISPNPTSSSASPLRAQMRSNLANLSNLTNITTDLSGLPLTPNSMHFPSPPGHGGSTLQPWDRDSMVLGNEPSFERGLDEHRALAGLSVDDDWI